MAGRPRRWAVGEAVPAVVLVLAVMAGVAGCSGEDSPGNVASRAASAAESAASRGQDALASATAEAGRRFEDVKDGVDAKKDVTLGKPATDGDGRTTVEVGARNTTGDRRSFTVQVDFKNADGAFRDTVVVTVSDVPPGETGRATARSTHDLSGEVRAEVARAVRH
jgi:hypothetical protein